MPDPGRAWPKIGHILFKRNLVTRDQIDQILRLQKTDKGKTLKFGEITAALKIASVPQVKEALVSQARIVAGAETDTRIPIVAPPENGTNGKNGKGTEVRKKRGTEVRRKGTEVRRKGTEVRRKGTEVRRKGTEVRRKTETGLKAQPPTRPEPVKKTSRKPLIIASLLAIPVLALVIFLATRGESAPADNSNAATTDGNNAAASNKNLIPEKPKTKLDRYIDSCMILAGKGDLGKALAKLDEFPVKMSPEPDAAERIDAARKDVLKKAEAIVAKLLAEARKMAEAGKLTEAVDHMKGIAALGITKLVENAYQKLRQTVDAMFQKRRVDAIEDVEADVKTLRERYASTKTPSDPNKTWNRAQAHLSRERYSEAIELLSSLAKISKWRTRALALRCYAHFGSEEFAGVLLDAKMLIESGVFNQTVITLLNRAVTRAPISESVLRLYRDALKKHPQQQLIWFSLAVVHTWRHEAMKAADVLEQARAKRVQFTLSLEENMRGFKRLKARGFPHGKAVYVDYVGPYEILTDTSPEKARKLATLLKGIAKEYDRLFPYTRNKNFRFRVMFFANKWDYNEYTRAILGIKASDRGFVAYYIPSIKQLVVWDNDKKFETTVRHEAFHQFLDSYVQNAPKWFNEGSAAFFEQSTPEKAKFNDYYHRITQTMLRKFPPLRQLLVMPREQWSGSRLEPYYYGQSWSFIYLLHKQGKADILKRYLHLLVLGRTRQQAYALTFGKLDMNAWQKKWQKAVLFKRYE